MAKGARASTTKSNHKALKNKVFGPVENARTERLSAKLLELASQPKPKQDRDNEIMEAEEIAAEDSNAVPVSVVKQTDDMEVDNSSNPKINNKSSKGRIEKRRSSRRAAIVFPKFKNGKRTGKTKPKAKK